MPRRIKQGMDQSKADGPVFDMKIGTLERFPVQSKRLFASFDARTLLLSLFLAFIGFLIFTPLLFLLYGSFETVTPDGKTVYSLQGWRQALDNPGIVSAIYNSFSLAIARQSIAIVVGILLAWLIARTDIPLRGWLEFSFWLSYFIPSLPVALGWILLLDPKYGLINNWLSAANLFQGTVVQRLFLLGNCLGSPQRQQHRHQSDAAYSGLSQPGRRLGRGLPCCRSRLAENPAEDCRADHDADDSSGADSRADSFARSF